MRLVFLLLAVSVSSAFAKNVRLTNASGVARDLIYECQGVLNGSGTSYVNASLPPDGGDVRIEAVAVWNGASRLDLTPYSPQYLHYVIDKSGIVTVYADTATYGELQKADHALVAYVLGALATMIMVVALRPLI